MNTNLWLPKGAGVGRGQLGLYTEDNRPYPRAGWGRYSAPTMEAEMVKNTCALNHFTAETNTAL